MSGWISDVGASGLGGNIAVAVRLWAGGAVAEREDVLVARALQCRVDDQLVNAVGFQAIQFVKEGGCLDPGGPHLEAGLDELALLGVQALGGNFADGGACEHRDTQVQQCLVHRLANALRQRSEEHTSELKSLMRNSYPVFCMKK